MKPISTAGLSRPGYEIPSRKCEWPAQAQRLIELMQTINFGRIEQLQVRNGEPYFDSECQVIREIKFGGENGPRAERDRSDFSLKHHIVECLNSLRSIPDGIRVGIEVKHGLPFRMIVPGLPVDSR